MNTIAAEWIFPVTSPALHNHAIEIQHGIIQKIRPINTEEHFDSGTCIIPGLINTHVHLAYTALRNLFDDLSFFPWIRKLTEIKYQKLTEQDIAASTRLGIAECIRAGITTVADSCDFETSLRELSQSPLRGIFYFEVFGVEKEQADKSWDFIRQQFPKLITTHATNKLHVGISPHACFTVRPELYEHIANWALQNKVPVSFHLSESREEEQFIKQRSGPIQNFLKDRAADWKILGNSSVQHLYETGIFETRPLVAHVVQSDDSDLDLLKRNHVSIAHCPKSNAKFGHGVAPVHSMLERNISVGLGTDSASSNNRLDLFEEARFALLQQRSHEAKLVLNEQTILELMTIRGAEALRMEKLIGSVEVGKQADLVVLKIPHYYKSANQVLFHLIHNVTPADVRQTMIAGEIISPEFCEVSAIYEKLSN